MNPSMRNFFRLLRNHFPRPSQRSHRLLRRLRRQQRRILSFCRSRTQLQGNEANQRRPSTLSCASDNVPENCQLLWSPISPVDESFDVGDRMLPYSYIADPVSRPPTRRGFHDWESFPGIPCQAEGDSEVASTTQPKARISDSWSRLRDCDYLQPPPLPLPDSHLVGNSGEDDDNESEPPNHDYDYIQLPLLPLLRLPFASEPGADEAEPTVSPLSEDTSSASRTSSPNPESPLCMAFSWPLNPRISIECIPIRTNTSEHSSAVTSPADLHHSNSTMVEDLRTTNTKATFAPFPGESDSVYESNLIPPIEPPSPQATVPMPPGFSTLGYQHRCPLDARLSL